MQARTARVTCPDCGVVTPLLVRLAVLYCVDTEDHTVSFLCPLCNRRTLTNADADKVDLLVDAGVGIREWSLPDELADPVRHDAALRNVLLDILASGSWQQQLEEL
jgi:predicted RNA-binding Zn-ribbon protein involved in translation (DUF1610 family)